MSTSNTPLYTALVALITAFLDGLTAFNVFPLSDAQKGIVLAIFSAAFAAALLLIPYFQHVTQVETMRLRSADPSLRAQVRR
jgi:hypothetical protein